MWHIHPTEKWIDDVVEVMKEKQLKPESSKFMIAFFSSMDNEFVAYFRKNKDQISSYSGQNFHIFTPLIYENNIIPDDQWRYMKSEFRGLGIPVESEPTLVFFNLGKNRKGYYEPSFFAGFVLNSFKDFSKKFKVAIDSCISTNDTFNLSHKLSEIFLSRNIITNDPVNSEFKHTIAKKLPKSTLFISHSSVDKPFARKLIEELSEDSSFQFWIDEKEILPGDDIQKIITHGLHNSDYLLIVISENSVKSSWVNFEIAQFMGFDSGNNIIPLLVSKNHNFPEPIDNLIRRLKYLDFTDETRWQENLDELKMKISRNYNKTR
jgi:hypothetical protein